MQNNKLVVKILTEESILHHVNKSINKLIEFYQESPEDFLNEAELHFLLFHFLAENEEFIKQIKFKHCENGRLLNPMIKTINEYWNKDRTKKSPGNFDIGIFNPHALKDEENPLVAIELKYDKRAYKRIFSKDIEKLTDQINKVKYPYFLYFGFTDNFDHNISSLLQSFNKNELKLYYITKKQKTILKKSIKNKNKLIQ